MSFHMSHGDVPSAPARCIVSGVPSGGLAQECAMSASGRRCSRLWGTEERYDRVSEEARLRARTELTAQRRSSSSCNVKALSYA